MGIKRWVGLTGVALLAAVALGTPSFAATTCDVKSMQAVVPQDTTIVSADKLDKPVAHCKVEGYVTTTNPGPNKVNFRLQLPEKANWAKRYYFIGLGGTAGYVPTDSQIPSGNPLVKGFAVAGTDTGHQYGSGDWSFLGREPAKALDHERRGAHVTAIATQAITKAYYGGEKYYRYHSGCSGGGRMGMEAIINYPEDYDGVLLGEPGIGPTFGSETMLAFIQLGQILNREPGAFLTPAKLEMVDKKVTEKCDPLDGAKDGVVWEHEVCSFDFKTLQCKSGDGPDCLTAPEIKSIEQIAAGPHGPKGKIKDGFPITNMSTWSVFIGSMPPPWPKDLTKETMRPGDGKPRPAPGYRIGDTTAKAYIRQDYYALTDFDFNNQKDIDAYWAGATRLGYGMPFSADLTKLKKTGHKVIFWNGVSAPCCLDQDLLKYYKESGEKSGGLSDSTTFYKVPAIGHCGGGTGPNDHADKLLEALMAWVEKGQKPGRVVSHRGDAAKPLFTDPNTGTVSGVVVAASVGSARDFLLCPYPTIAKFNGKKGGENDAANWECK